MISSVRPQFRQSTGRAKWLSVGGRVRAPWRKLTLPIGLLFLISVGHGKEYRKDNDLAPSCGCGSGLDSNSARASGFRIGAGGGKGQGHQLMRRVAAIAFQIAALLTLFGYLGLAVVAAAPPLEPELICRAAIGLLMDRDPKAFRVTRTDGRTLFLSYVRPIDNFDWTYRCKILGNRVIWASEPGRWREDPKDDRVSFEIVAGGRQIRIIDDRSDGSPTIVLFDLDRIQ